MIYDNSTRPFLILIHYSSLIAIIILVFMWSCNTILFSMVKGFSLTRCAIRYLRYFNFRKQKDIYVIKISYRQLIQIILDKNNVGIDLGKIFKHPSFGEY